MSDNQPNPRSNDKPAGPDPLAGLVGKDIDKLLAEAQSLAANVAAELGVGSGSGKPAAPNAGSEPVVAEAAPAAGARDIDAALAEMETLLSEGSDATGAGRAEDDVSAPRIAEPAPQSPAEDEITAILRDLPDPTEPAAPASKEGTSAVATLRNSESDGGIEATAPGRLARLRAHSLAGLKRVPRLVAASPLWILLGVCWVVDLPFSWMSPSLKEKLAYLGMATAIMAAVAWSIVLLRHG